MEAYSSTRTRNRPPKIAEARRGLSAKAGIKLLSSSSRRKTGGRRPEQSKRTPSGRVTAARPATDKKGTPLTLANSNNPTLIIAYIKPSPCRIAAQNPQGRLLASAAIQNALSRQGRCLPIHPAEPTAPTRIAIQRLARRYRFHSQARRERKNQHHRRLNIPPPLRRIQRQPPFRQIQHSDRK